MFVLKSQQKNILQGIHKIVELQTPALLLFHFSVFIEGGILKRF